MGFSKWADELLVEVYNDRVIIWTMEVEKELPLPENCYLDGTSHRKAAESFDNFIDLIEKDCTIYVSPLTGNSDRINIIRTFVRQNPVIVNKLGFKLQLSMW